LSLSFSSLASIHPCRHGPAMAKIVAALMESGTTPNVEQYLPIFLKFMQSVIPTIEYDYTSNATVHHVEK
jgi:ubiquitin-like-conjugating enzyme ATG3